MTEKQPLSKLSKVYEKPVLLDLEKVAAGCGFCVTGGGRVADVGN